MTYKMSFMKSYKKEVRNFWSHNKLLLVMKMIISKFGEEDEKEE